MQDGLPIEVCRGCGTAYFPVRFICHVCSGSTFDAAVSISGSVEEITVVSHVIGQEGWSPRPLATVRLVEGPCIIAGLVDEVGEGMTVTLLSEGQVPYVKRA